MIYIDLYCELLLSLHHVKLYNSHDLLFTWVLYTHSDINFSLCLQILNCQIRAHDQYLIKLKTNQSSFNKINITHQHHMRVFNNTEKFFIIIKHFISCWAEYVSWITMINSTMWQRDIISDSECNHQLCLFDFAKETVESLAKKEFQCEIEKLMKSASNCWCHSDSHSHQFHDTAMLQWFLLHQSSDHLHSLNCSVTDLETSESQSFSLALQRASLTVIVQFLT